MNLFDLHAFTYWLPLGSFVAGLTATPHCAVMCGPLFVIFGGGGFAYQVGRVVGYVSVGALLGLFGATVDRTAHEWLLLQNASVYLTGLLFIAYGLWHLAPGSVQRRANAAHVFSGPGRLLVRVLGRLRARVAVQDAANNTSQHATKVSFATFAVPVVAGTFSALLPCGVLIPLWLLAAGTGSAAGGALLTAGFVLGTLPGASLLAWSGRRFASKNLALPGRALGATLLCAGIALLGLRLSAFESQNPEHANHSNDATRISRAADPAVCHTPADLFSP